MSVNAPLPSKELIESVSSYEFLQNSLKNPSNSYSNAKFTFITYKISTIKVINGWNQKNLLISKLSLTSANELLNKAHLLIESSMKFSANLEIIRLRFDTRFELFIIPDLAKDLCICVLIERDCQN